MARPDGRCLLDYPELPLRKAFPRRLYWAIGGALLAVFAAVVMIFVQDRYRVMQDDPERREDLSKLAEAVRRPSWR